MNAVEKNKTIKGKVLVVDDAPDTVEIIRSILSFEGYEVLCASTGEEGVIKAEKERPEVVLMDISLPGMNGNEALRRMREKNSIQSIIMLTSYATVDNVIDALHQGATDFIKKPFNNEQLIETVSRSLHRYWMLKERERLEEEVKRLSITDDLTGLYNYRHFYKTVEAEVARLRRQKSPLSLLMCDVDNFKRYNDLYGHVEGDKVLRKIGEIIGRLIRSNVDSGYRYGGDEFAVLLIGARLEQALPIAERIRHSIEGAGFRNITISIGVTEFQPHFDVESFVKSADDALYMAKQLGRNRICTYPIEGSVRSPEERQRDSRSCEDED